MDNIKCLLKKIREMEKAERDLAQYLIKKLGELIEDEKEERVIGAGYINANQLKDCVDYENILVPDEIKIVQSMYWYSYWIQNWNKLLYYYYPSKDWIVIPWDNQESIKCKLTPCKYEDLKPWDVFYRSNFDDCDFKDLHLYWKKLNDWSYQFWNNKTCMNNDKDWNHYWKVEAI